MPKEYIERNALINEINKNIIENPNERCAQILEAILYAPAADVAEVKHGKWIKDKNKRTCNICGFLYLENGKTTFNYCPNCGAKNG